MPTVTIVLNGWIGVCLAIGFMVPIVVASLAAGYILGTFFWGRLTKTVLGIHLRHWLTRREPSKFFPSDYVSDKVK